MGYSSLPVTNGGVVLARIPLTWSASQPAAVAPGANCTLSCAISTPSVGSATISASCSPPACNVGWPYVPSSLSTQLQISTCNSFFQAQYPQFVGCEQLIPEPVYALSPVSPTPPATQIPQTGGISGLVTGTTGAASVLATSTGCAAEPPITCLTGIYSFATAKAVPGSVHIMPITGNSLIYDLAGDRAYMGSQFGAQLLNPSNFGTNSGVFTPLGTVTGQALAVSNSGTISAFSDTLNTPNQVYIVNAGNPSAISTTALNINQAVAAAFSPDGLKTFILSDLGDSLYVYSPLQALQGPGLQGAGSNPQLTLTGRANSIALSPNGAFAFVSEISLNGSTPNLTAFSVCDNSLAGSVSLPADPLFMRVLPDFQVPGTDSSGNSFPLGVHIFLLDSTGFDVITATTATPAAGLCPQTLTLSAVQRVELGQGTIEPLNFFASADGSLLYVVTTNSSSVLAYNFGTGSVIAIPLVNNALPQSAFMTVDAGTILVTASDGQLHEVSTSLGGSDFMQVPFPDLPNYLNAFCSFTPSAGPCSFNLLAVRP